MNTSLQATLTGCQGKQHQTKRQVHAQFQTAWRQRTQVSQYCTDQSHELSGNLLCISETVLDRSECQTYPAKQIIKSASEHASGINRHIIPVEISKWLLSHGYFQLTLFLSTSRTERPSKAWEIVQLKRNKHDPAIQQLSYSTKIVTWFDKHFQMSMLHWDLNYTQMCTTVMPTHLPWKQLLWRKHMVELNKQIPLPLFTNPREEVQSKDLQQWAAENTPAQQLHADLINRPNGMSSDTWNVSNFRIIIDETFNWPTLKVQFVRKRRAFALWLSFNAHNLGITLYSLLKTLSLTLHVLRSQLRYIRVV